MNKHSLTQWPSEIFRWPLFLTSQLRYGFRLPIVYATHTIGSLKPYARGLPEPFKRRQTGEHLLSVALGGDAVV
nr:hypothetical protein [uncultured Kingella sp.]